MDHDKLLRKTKEKPQSEMFEMVSDWHSHWWDMPSFEMKDAMPEYKITMNFMTGDDLMAFADKMGIKVTTRTNSAWYPPQDRLNGEYCYDGPKTDSRYPICIPSKGRWDNQTTGRALDEMGVSYKFFVEETEYDNYCNAVGENNVVRLPFSNLGQGSIPARNAIWEWAREREFKRHWTLDDNLMTFSRLNTNRRLKVKGGGFFKAMEDFVDRYENVAMAGPHDQGFVPDRVQNTGPYLLNSRIYSCILLDTTLDHRWRGRYNEDTDLSLRLLKDGYCTVLFRALLMSKPGTVGSKAGGMKGGNTDTVYAGGDHRLAFAESLKEQHPDCVEVVWRFGRWHHKVDYSAFKNNALITKPGITPRATHNNYSMTLAKMKQEESNNE